jgi:hypothetical protein
MRRSFEKFASLTIPSDWCGTRLRSAAPAIGPSKRTARSFVAWSAMAGWGLAWTQALVRPYAAAANCALTCFSRRCRAAVVAGWRYCNERYLGISPMTCGS